MSTADSRRATDAVEPPPIGADVSTIVASLSLHGFVPSLLTEAPGSVTDPLRLRPGQQIDDFRIAAVLGQGAFGIVYLAWQESLGREIALKVSPCVGFEGRTLARLDHPNIVRVHSEAVRDGMRMLCMQYVPSVDLAQLLHRLSDQGAIWTGAALLSAVDASLPLAAGFDPQQLADRQRLAELDHVSAVCWITARLADAVAHAHRQGVLHRDLKPGNVLVTQYGRPMLVDFNLADFSREDAKGSGVFGGTLPYMSPEHLDAFNSEHAADASQVTQQSDIYSLGVMLYELLTGALPFATPPGLTSQSEQLGWMAADRRSPERVWTCPQFLAQPALLSVLQRSLAAAPADRWASADEMSRALDGVIDLRQARSEVECSGPWPQWCRSRPFRALILVGLMPHILGSFVNIPYNLLRIVAEEQRGAFWRLVNVYNVAVYPLCIALCFAVVWPVFRHWRRLSRGDEPVALDEADRIRRRVATFPVWAIGVALLGWLPGAVVFPWGLHAWAGPLGLWDVLHFQVSFALSGMIALTYSALGVLCLTVGIFYPNVCSDPIGFRRQAAEDALPWGRLLGVLPFLAVAIPLAGVALLIGTSPKSFSDAEYRSFQWLTVGLIALGMIGFQAAMWSTGVARAAIDALLGRASRR